MKVEPYSEKSYAIYGSDTKEYKEQLKELGAKFNRNLENGPGWTISKKKYEELKESELPFEFEKSKKSLKKKSSPKIKEKIETSENNDSKIHKEIIEKLDAILNNDSYEKILLKLDKIQKSLKSIKKHLDI